jgi:hypothetical protein
MMCLMVVAMAAMLVVEGVSSPETVQEAATAAAEEVEDWRGGWQVV